MARPRPDRPPLRTGRKLSAGGVPYRRGPRGLEVALVGRTAQRIWALPKGTPIVGETREATALREVSEETGLQVRLVAPLGDIQYWFVDSGTRFQKTVTFYLMEAIGGDIADHDAEYDEVQWFPAAEAVSRATYASERDIIERALRQLIPANTATGGDNPAGGGAPNATADAG